MSTFDDFAPYDDDDIVDTLWQDYCAEARRLDRYDILRTVLSSLDTDDSPLYALIDSCLKTPQEPGRAIESRIILAAVGQSILNYVAASVDDQVGMLMVTR